MYAVIKTGGKQYSVKEGDVVFIEKLDSDAGEKVVFNEVVAVVDGANSAFGAPLVNDACVEATVVKNGRSKKVIVFKYNPKKGYSKKQGHRQPYTKVQIDKISV
jgi:large subunit ribosomal protein L21